MNNDLDIHFKHSDSDAVGTAFALWIEDSLLHWLGLPFKAGLSAT